MTSASSRRGLRPVRVERVRVATPRPRITIGLVNNMPDSALRATERQFLRHLEPAARELELRVRLFYLPEIRREDAAREYLLTRYAPADELPRAELDALIVTGCEPQQPRLRDEPYWPRLAALVDWARENTVSTIWSCLAAHAAVLHLDHIERQRLPAKISGLYEFARLSDHPLLFGAAGSIHVPHSRLNDLRPGDLAKRGYELLTHSEDAGVDSFVKECPSLFLFLQGHPEYNDDSLFREYRRDMARFLAGRSETCPPLPQGYFGSKATLALTAFAEEARAARRPELMTHFPRIEVRPPRQSDWHASAARLYANWLNYVTEAKSGRTRHVDHLLS
jgi:homoserine O-succinyltransferase